MKAFWLIVLLIILGGVYAAVTTTFDEEIDQKPDPVTTFEECVAAGNPVMESYPERCRTPEGETFTRNIGNELEKTDLIRISNPRPGDVIESPLTITGEARGYWFFEGDFPIVLTDWDGKIIAQHYASFVHDPEDSESTWMTEDFVPFEAIIEFENPSFGSTDTSHFSHRGSLILQKDNPSGLPENDDALEIPVTFK